MMMDLGRVTSELASWKTGVGVVMKGVGNNFCSGGDLNLVKEIANPSDGLLMAKYMHAVLTQVAECNKRFVSRSHISKLAVLKSHSLILRLDRTVATCSRLLL